MRRKAEHMRDRVMAGLGTQEAFVEDDLSAEYPHVASISWRKPLRLDEIAQLPSDNRNVRARLGRA